MPLQLYNTRTRASEVFQPLHDAQVGLYTCGPTVYSSPHLGNYRSYVFADTLKRVLRFNGLAVTHVVNITDVGHLNARGEDKFERSAAGEGHTVWDIAEKYTAEFKNALEALNIIPPDRWMKATDHVPDQIALIERLVAKGVTYETEQALYFDVATFPTYTALAGQALDEKTVAAREDVVADSAKRNAADFALWFKRVGKFKDHAMHWPSPWGEGFPGWHIECSAMSMKALGEQFDLHTGGIDHIPVHHTNEIAQSEAATGKAPFVNVWMHGEFLVLPSGRMGKSEGNALTIATLAEHGLDPLAYRFFLLQAHYRQPLTFSWDALEAAAKGYRNLCLRMGLLRGKPKIGCAEFEREFRDAVNDDLNTAKALAVLQRLLKSTYPDEAKLESARTFDAVLGLKLDRVAPVEVPDALLKTVRAHIEAREALRAKRQFAKADGLRNQINADLAPAGFVLEDTENGPVIAPKR
ncbi:MAG: cysteine--tRNA ligase [Candidatus Kerfeldbacteria bacterium]|nr:cysteine--tRNA ligase [Candidatus Kerfeldbacteria bacterium]